MKIDEPDTPWASPPKELFEDPAEAEADVAMDDVAERLRGIEGGPEGGGGDAPGAVAGDASISAKKDDEWESSDDDERDDGARGGRVALDPGALSDPGSSAAAGGTDEDGEDIIDEGPLDEYDRMLRARLFEAQRKSHQCTFRGVLARGRALLEEEDEEDGE